MSHLLLSVNFPNIQQLTSLFCILNISFNDLKENNIVFKLIINDFCMLFFFFISENLIRPKQSLQFSSAKLLRGVSIISLKGIPHK